MFLNVESKLPRDFPAGRKYSVVWQLLHYLTPQEWHKEAKEKSNVSTTETITLIYFLGGGRANVGHFNLFS